MYGSGALVLEKVKASAEIVAMLLKSWSGELRSGLAKLRHLSLDSHCFPRPGLFYLNINGRQAVTSLVDSLSNQSPGIRVRLMTDPVLRAKEANGRPSSESGCPARHVARRLQRPMQNN